MTRDNQLDHLAALLIEKARRAPDRTTLATSLRSFPAFASLPVFAQDLVAALAHHAGQTR